MEFKARAFNPVTMKTDCLVVIVPATPSSAAAEIDKAAGALIASAIKDGELKKFLNTLTSYNPSGLAAKRLVLISSGEKDLKSSQFSKLCGKIASLLKSMPIKTAAISFADVVVSDRDESWAATELARKVGEELYVFDQCKSKKEDPVKLTKLELMATSAAAAQKLNKALEKGAALARGINLARELGDLPANICTPSHLATTA